nr:MAG TPA: hypothetical protein [Caudoviricetes sp.]
MIRAIQRSVGALDNGWIGNQTLSDIAAKLGADCWPLNVELYGQPTLIARDIEPVNMSGPLPKNAISGSFSWQGQPCSILVRGGKVVRGMSCHYPRPESVLYKTTDGAVRIARVSSAAGTSPPSTARVTRSTHRRGSSMPCGFCKGGRNAKSNC